MSNTVRVPTVDKNGKQTHVWRNPDVPGGNKSFDRLGNVMTQFVPLSSESEETMFNGIVLTGDGAHLSPKEGNPIPLNIPELSILGNIVSEYPIEWGAPEGNYIKPINSTTSAGWEDGKFVIKDRDHEDIVLTNDEAYLLNSNIGVYMNTARDIDGYTSTHGYVNIVRSPVGEVENYSITLGEDSMMTTYIQDSGFSDGDFGTNDRDEVTFYRESPNDNSVKIQISYNDDIDLSDHIDTLTEEELNDFTSNVNDALAKIDERLVANFDSPEDVTILFNDVSDRISDSQDGKVSFFTSNVLHSYSQREHMDIMDKAWSAFYKETDY